MNWLNKSEPQRQAPRTMSQDELDSLLGEHAPAQRTIEQIRWEIRSRNPVRWRRMQRDMKWAKKVMKKLGYNPEDVRWIL